MGKVDCEASERDQEVGLRPWFGRRGRTCCLRWDTVLSEDSICFARFDLVLLFRVPRRAMGSTILEAWAACTARDWRGWKRTTTWGHFIFIFITAATCKQNTQDVIYVSGVVVGTIAGDLFFLTLQVLRAVFFEGRESSELSDAIQKGLLLLLRVSCQNLLGQPQFLVGLPLLTRRWKNRKRSSGVLAGFYWLPRSLDILYDLCMSEGDSGEGR